LNNKRLLIVLAFIAALSPCLLADQTRLTLPEVLSQIEDVQQKTQTLQFNFTQFQKFSGLPAPRVKKGKMTIKTPGHMRIDQASPQAQTIVRVEDKLEVFTPDHMQILKGSWLTWIRTSGFPSTLIDLFGNFRALQVNERYAIVFGGYDEGSYRLTLKPKRGTGPTIDIWVAEETFLVSRGRLNDSQGVVDVKVSQMKHNIAVPDSRFRIRVPPGTAVIPLPS
jgi:outer membrane lipoprotein-sorting protein